MHREVPQGQDPSALLRRLRHQAGRRFGSREGGRRPQRRPRMQQQASHQRHEARHERLLHDELPRAGRQGHPRELRDRPRLHHHHPRRDGNPDHHRHAEHEEVRSPSGPFGNDQPLPDLDRFGDGHHRDLPGAQGQAQRSGGPRPPFERKPHRLRLRGEETRHEGGGQRGPQEGLRERSSEGHPGVRDEAFGQLRLHRRHPQLDHRRALDAGDRRDPRQDLRLVRQRSRVLQEDVRARQHHRRDKRVRNRADLQVRVKEKIYFSLPSSS
mmetsp:Transcript_18902/g.43838  ORF Transcript_18902/g.43838 Transcript_18902/m.43838 type:complete len:269 (-) Transcript_18902:3209-4015(-)